MLQNTRVVAFAFSELFRENQQGGEGNFNCFSSLAVIQNKLQNMKKLSKYISYCNLHCSLKIIPIIFYIIINISILLYVNNLISCIQKQDYGRLSEILKKQMKDTQRTLFIYYQIIHLLINNSGKAFTVKFIRTQRQMQNPVSDGTFCKNS